MYDNVLTVSKLEISRNSTSAPENVEADSSTVENVLCDIGDDMECWCRG